MPSGNDDKKSVDYSKASSKVSEILKDFSAILEASNDKDYRRFAAVRDKFLAQNPDEIVTLAEKLESVLKKSGIPIHKVGEEFKVIVQGRAVKLGDFCAQAIEKILGKYRDVDPNSDNFKQVGSLQIFLLTLGELGFPKSELEPANKLINQLLAGKRVSRSIEAVRVEYQQAEDHFSEKVRRLDALHTESEALVKKARDLNINESIVGELEKEQEKLLQHREQLWGVVSTLEDWSQLEHVDVLEFGLNQVYKLINLGDCKSATEYSKTYADTEPDSFAQLKQAIAEAEHAIERKAEARAQEKAAERAREVSAQAAEEASAREDRIRLEKMDESLSAELSSVFKLIDQEMKVHQKAPDKSKAQRISYQLEQLNTELQNAREEVQLKKDSNIVQIRATFRQTIATLLTKFIEALYSRFSHHKDFQESKLGQGLKELGYTASGETLDSSQFTATDVRPIRTQSALVVGNKENQDPHSKLGRAHTTHHFPRPGVFR